MNSARRTSALLVAVLTGSGLVIGRLLPPTIIRLDGTVPRVSWAAAIALLVAAGVVGVFAWNTWQSLHKRHERMAWDHGLKMLALAKSAVTVGALAAGVYAGFALTYVDAMSSPLGRERVLHGGGAAIASLLLLAAALLLERACQVPGDDEDGDGKGNGSSKGRAGPTPA